MKKLSILSMILLVTVIVASSCASSRKYGCPGNPQANYKFRG